MESGSFEIEVPPAKARWCLLSSRASGLALKLKYHRLKPVVSLLVKARGLAWKLKYHRLKPGGVVLNF